MQLHEAAENGHAAVSKQLLAARCNIDLETKDGLTALQIAQSWGLAGIATLIRNTQQEDADRAMKELLMHERAMKELLMHAARYGDKRDFDACCALWQYSDCLDPAVYGM